MIPMQLLALKHHACDDGKDSQGYHLLNAGTCREYSASAMPHEKRMTPMSGQWVEMFISDSFRCPYQAKVMKIFDPISRTTVMNGDER